MNNHRKRVKNAPKNYKSAITGIDMRTCWVDCAKEYLNMTVILPFPGVPYITEDTDDTDEENTSETSLTTTSGQDDNSMSEDNFYASKINLSDKWYEKCEYNSNFTAGGNAQMIENDKSNQGTIKCGDVAEIDYRCSSYRENVQHLAKNPPADGGSGCWCRLRSGDKSKKWVFNYDYAYYGGGGTAAGCADSMLAMFQGGNCRQHCASYVKAGNSFWLKRLNYDNVTSLTILPDAAPVNWNKTCYDPNKKPISKQSNTCDVWADKEYLCLKKGETPYNHGAPNNNSGECYFRLKKDGKHTDWMHVESFKAGSGISAYRWCAQNCSWHAAYYIYKHGVTVLDNPMTWLYMLTRDDLK